MNKHTKAPWAAIKNKSGYTISADDNVVIAEVYYNLTNGEPNARLIAAAPDYFAVVEAILNDDTLSAEHIRNMLRPVQSKAKG